MNTEDLGELKVSWRFRFKFSQVKRPTASLSPISHGKLDFVRFIELHARSLGNLASSAARAASSRSIDPACSRSQHQAHILLVLRDRIKSSDGPPKVL